MGGVRELKGGGGSRRGGEWREEWCRNYGGRGRVG